MLTTPNFTLIGTDAPAGKIPQIYLFLNFLGSCIQPFTDHGGNMAYKSKFMVYCSVSNVTAFDLSCPVRGEKSHIWPYFEMHATF